MAKRNNQLMTEEVGLSPEEDAELDKRIAETGKSLEENPLDIDLSEDPLEIDFSEDPLDIVIEGIDDGEGLDFTIEDLYYPIGELNFDEEDADLP